MELSFRHSGRSSQNVGDSSVEATNIQIVDVMHLVVLLFLEDSRANLPVENSSGGIPLEESTGDCCRYYGELSLKG